jgi:CRP-like cAMP-binding protein
MGEDSRDDASLSVAERLRNIPLFTQLTEEEVTRITEVARERTYPKNSVILFEDDPGDALYVVLAGEVKVVLIGEDGREVILSMLRSGDFFGEMSLIDDQPRSAHVIATEDSNLLVLRRDEFRQCLEQAPRIALGLLQALSRRLRRADDTIGGLVLLDVSHPAQDHPPHARPDDRVEPRDGLAHDPGPGRTGPHRGLPKGHRHPRPPGSRGASRTLVSHVTGPT